MRERRIGKICLHCKQWRKSWAKGLCQGCYLKHGADYPRLARRNQWTAPPVTDEPDENTVMPETAYAVVRVIRSPISGKLRVMIGWYPKPGEAKLIAKKCCRHFSCRVERWICVGRGKPGATRPRRLRKRRGSLHYETVAVYPRRSGKRVAA